MEITFKLLCKSVIALIVLMLIFLTGCTDNEKAMVEAVQTGNTPMVQSLLDQGVSPNLKTDDGKTILMLAAYLGHVDIAKLLIDKGADVNAKDNGGKTALMYTAQAGNIEMARLLLENGADLDAVDNEGHTALESAKTYQQTAMVEFLSNWGKPVPTATPVETPTATATPIPRPTPTPAPTYTPTPAPSIMPLPTATATSVPTPVAANQQLGPIFFDFDKSVYNTDQTAALEDILAIAKAHSALYIILGGHADERGTREYNLELSLRRAKTIQTYLVDNGIAPKRIIIYGFGKEHPLKTGHDEASQSSNRRVDLLLWDSVLTEAQVLAEILK